MLVLIALLIPMVLSLACHLLASVELQPAAMPPVQVASVQPASRLDRTRLARLQAKLAASPAVVSTLQQAKARQVQQASQPARATATNRKRVRAISTLAQSRLNATATALAAMPARATC